MGRLAHRSDSRSLARDPQADTEGGAGEKVEGAQEEDGAVGAEGPV